MVSAPVSEALDAVDTAMRALWAAKRRLEALPAPGDDPLPGLGRENDPSAAATELGTIPATND